jgi:hypothetical protein
MFQLNARYQHEIDIPGGESRVEYLLCETHVYYSTVMEALIKAFEETQAVADVVERTRRRETVVNQMYNTVCAGFTCVVPYVR